MPRSRALPEILVLLLICGGFAAAHLAYRVFFPDNFGFLTSDELSLGFVTSTLTFWFGVRLADAAPHSWWQLFDEFRIGTGLNLIIQAVLNYFDLLTRSIFLIVVGGCFAAVLLAWARRLLRRGKPDSSAGTLIVGFDSLAAALHRGLGEPVIGVVGDRARVPPELTWLGDFDQFESVVARRTPVYILVAQGAENRIACASLLQQRLRGAKIIRTPDLFEELEQRVHAGAWKPVDAVVSRTISGNSRAVALQAVYNNLIGLVLLLAASPLIAAAALLLFLFAGRGPLIEATQCAGFQKIPFRQLRFRTRGADGSLTRVGRWLLRWRLAGLPLLFNIVRGEMALFGPRPVRAEFAERLSQLLPFYSMRFAVQPGIISWSTVQSGQSRGRLDALAELEYDLYYVEHGSPLLDLEILMRLIFDSGQGQESRADFVPARR